MPDYRRPRVPGGTYFFTVVTHRRIKLFSNAHARTLLGNVLRRCAQNRPFSMDAIVLLPDHLHAIWTLPSGDADYSGRWSWIKHEFTRLWLEGFGRETRLSVGRQRERRRGVWQPRFWEHTIETDDDFERHFDYLHYNPVKHGLVASPGDWLWSSFHRWVRAGVYPPDWGRSFLQSPFTDIANTVGE